MQSQSFSDVQRSVLVQTSGSSLNVVSNASHARKRKSFDVEANESQCEIFTARSLAVNGQTCTFRSVALVARACLPLAWLRTSQHTSQSTLVPETVFEAAVSSVQEWEQRVLVVRKTPNSGLYAVERVGRNAYVACPLHDWVSEEWIRDAAIGKVAEVKLEDLLKKEEAVSRGHVRAASGSSFTALPTPKSPKRPTNRRGALARMSILSAKDSIGQQVAESSISLGTFQQSPLTPSQVTEPLPITPAAQIEQQNPFETTASLNHVIQEPKPIVQPTAAEISNPNAPERLRTQYFEHLYTSKTSLAFYVKGPLSRARAHVRSAEFPSSSISDLSDFYEQSILSTKKIDLKYKESLSKVIKGLSIEQEDGEAQRKRSRKKKMKLGKDCLWPEEEDFIAKWWRGRDLKSTVSPTDQAEEMRKELADLRMRETKMQMLLMLEVMLLETAATRLSEKPIPTDPEVKVESVEDEAAALLATTLEKPPKKKRDLANEIDTVVDRLCIWHTVSLDDVVTGEESQNNTSKPNDSLRDFCKDVLLPFYSAKLPDQAKSISRKLGGPEISPKRPTQLRPPTLHRSSSSSTLHKTKPGQPLAKRTLERVLSEDHLHRHISPPALSRSSTAPMNPIIPTLKREPSERPTSRGGMLSKSVSFSNREIDLVADSKAHEAKRRKFDRLAQQKRELEAAIDALKRPSRMTVAGAFMDEVEKRQEKIIQISATPRAQRVKEQFEPELPPMPRSVLQGQETSVIPSSTIKPRFRTGNPTSRSIPRSSATKRAVLTAIHETPSRGIDKKTSNPLDLPPLQSAQMVDPTSIAATPVPRRTHFERDHPSSELNLPSSQPQSVPAEGSSGAHRSHMTRSRRPVLFTPVKKSDVRLDQAFRDAPEIPEQAGRMMDRVMGGKGRGLDAVFEDQVNHITKKSGISSEQKIAPFDDVDEGDIYDKLGWNDDFDY